MNLAIALAALFISTLLAVIAAAPKRPPRLNCKEKLVAFSHCLPYVSEPPNNLTTSVPPHCCDAISYVFNSTDKLCICYLLRKPYLYGFPLNHSDVLSLPSLCSARTTVSLESFCPSGTKRLPPLLNPTPETSEPSHSGAGNSSSQSSISAPSPLSYQPNSTESSPNYTFGSQNSTKWSPTPISNYASSKMTKISRNGWYLPAALILLSYVDV